MLTQEDPALEQMLTQEDPALTQKLTQEDPALEQILAQEDLLGPAASGSTKEVSLNQLLTTDSQHPENKVEVLNSTSDLQTTNTPTELPRGRGAQTLQGEQHDRHQHDEGQGYVRLLRKPDPTLQMADDLMNNAAKVDVDMNDNPWDEINAGQNTTSEETDTTTPGEETSTDLGGGLGNDRTALVTLQDEFIKLRGKMTILETSQSNLLTRLLELDTKPSPVKITKLSDPGDTNDSTLTETTTHEPESMEPCARAAFDTKTE
jgi:hypothetical protein